MRNLNEKETAIANKLFEKDSQRIFTKEEWEELKAFIQSIPAVFSTEQGIETSKMIANGILCKMLEIEYRSN